MRIFLLILVLLSLQLCAFSQQQCSSVEYRLEMLKNSPAFSARMHAVEAFTRNFINKKKDTKDTVSVDKHPSIITIPVVVHVVYNSSSQNISDAQIRSQIDVLNKDYRRLNGDTINTPQVFRPVAADCDIQFELANIDPSGHATTGITRKSTSILAFNIDDHIKSAATGGDDAWDCDNYLNIWVGNLTSGILGYASVPGSAKEKDGVVIQYSVFGTTGTVSAPFNKGRTTTHEIGHWLNLIHTWGDADCGDDHVDDTPPQRAANRGCPGAMRVTCGSGPDGDMYMNYMDFTDDACMNMFTKGQRDRMLALFAPGGPRSAMLASTALMGAPNSNSATAGQEAAGFHIYPNPASGIIYLDGYSLQGATSTVDIYNEMGQKVMTARVNQHTAQQLNVSSLKSGMYYIKVDDGKSRNISRFIKM